MSTKKQRRRRVKERRHEWEEVYLDAEGNEIPPEEAAQLLPQKDGKREARKEPRKGEPRRRGGMRTIQPPSWKRVFKRAAIFAPIMYVFIALTSRDTSAATNVLITVQLLVIFLPFSYLMDTLTYRMWKKRQAKQEGG